MISHPRPTTTEQVNVNPQKMVINYINIAREITVGATDEGRWVDEILTGRDGSDAQVLVAARGLDARSPVVEVRLHRPPEDPVAIRYAAMEAIPDLVETVDFIRREGLSNDQAVERYFGKFI